MPSPVTYVRLRKAVLPRIPANGAVVLSDGSVTALKLAPGSVTNEKLATLAVANGNIQDSTIANAKLAPMAAATIKGRASGAGTGAATDLTGEQVRTIAGVAEGHRALGTLISAGGLFGGDCFGITQNGIYATLRGVDGVLNTPDGALGTKFWRIEAQITDTGRRRLIATEALAGLTGEQYEAVDTGSGFGSWSDTARNYRRPGIATPAIQRVLSKLSHVADIRDWDAVDLTGANDEAPTVQAAINETTGLTNPVPIKHPGGKIALGSTITTKNGTVLEGPLKAAGSYDTKPAWFHITHTGVGFTNQDNLGAQKFIGINTYRTQPTPGGGAFTPNANDFDFDFVGAQDILMQDCHLHNPTKAIQIRGRTSGAITSGRITLRGITGQPLSEGIRATHCLDVVNWDEVHFWPFWSSNANVITRTRTTASAFILGRMDNPKFGRIFCWGYYRGMIVNQQGADGSLPTGTTSLLRCGSFEADNTSVGLLVNTGADSASLSFGSIQASSDPASPSTSAENLYWCLASNTRVDFGSLFGQYTTSYLMALNGTGNVWTIAGPARSSNISGAADYFVDTGNTLRLGFAPQTSAAAKYAGTGTIETPDWRSYTPTITTGAGTITTLGTVAGFYRRQGKSVAYRVSIPITTNGTGATDVKFTLPFTNGSAVSIGRGRETAVTGLGLAVTINTSGTTGSIVIAHTNAYPGADGRTLVVEGEYEAA